MSGNTSQYISKRNSTVLQTTNSKITVELNQGLKTVTLDLLQWCSIRLHLFKLGVPNELLTMCINLTYLTCNGFYHFVSIKSTLLSIKHFGFVISLKIETIHAVVLIFMYVPLLGG